MKQRSFVAFGILKVLRFRGRGRRRFKAAIRAGQAKGWAAK